MNNYLLYIHTITREYKEHWYSLECTLERVAEISDCVNITMIDLLDFHTGEVLLTVENGELEYIDAEMLAKRLAREEEEYPV